MSFPHESESRWAGLREVLGMSGPIILGSISFTIMMFADNAMVARTGTDAFAAIGSAGLWSYISACFLLGVVGCVSTFVAQCYGRGTLEDCARYAWQGIYLSVVAGVLGLVMWPLSEPLFRLMGHTEEVTRLELIYFRIRLLGFLPIACISGLAAFFQAIGRPGIPMWAGIGANLANLGLNYILIFGHFGVPALGIAGAAIATVASMVMQMAALLYIFLSPSMDRRFHSRAGRSFDVVKLRELVRVGFPVGLVMFMDVANWGIFTSFIVGYFGSVALASHNAAINFMHLAFMPAVGVNQGIAAIVGQHIGRERPDLAQARTYTALRLTMMYMFSVGAVLAVFGKPLIAACFVDDPAVLNLGHTLLLLAAIFQAFDAINITVSGALRGAGDTRWMAFMTFFFAYFFFLPLSLIMAFSLKGGAVGAWVSATVYIIGLSGFLLARFRAGHWREMRIFSTNTTPVSDTPS